MRFKNNYTIIIQARLSSKRFPSKILSKINGSTIIDFMLSRLKYLKFNCQFWLATSINKTDDRIEKIFSKKINVFRGKEEDVLDRYYTLATQENAKHIIRLTSDCPFVDPSIIEKAVLEYEQGKFDYVSNVLERSYPDGLDVEVFNFKTLKNTFIYCKDELMREHVTPYMRSGNYKEKITGEFKVKNFKNDTNFSHIRWTLDYKEDLDYLQNVARYLGNQFHWMEAVALLTKKRFLLQQNQSYYIRDESIKNRKKILNKKKSFKKTNNLFNKAIKIIPLASQTFSKSFIQFPKNAAPLFAKSGKGAIIKDIDGNEYIDYIMGLLPIVLGYNDPSVNSAIVRQLDRGITFSLASDLEFKLSNILCNIIPSAQMVRFGKNGSDVNTAAIRLARAYTQRERIAVCGYHGWHDWYIGSTTRDEGVPSITKQLTSSCSLDDLNKIYDLLRTEKYAAIILEPAGQSELKVAQIRELRNITKKFGTLLIFDEIISGFRIDLGGAQNLLNICPDISTFGKAMANGMPLSAIVGKKKIFKKMEDIFFSTTFGGESLSIAASIATIKKIKKYNAIAKISTSGKILINELNLVLKSLELQDFLKFDGPDWWPRIKILDSKINNNLYKTLLRQQNIENGLLLNSSLNLSLSHCTNINIVNTKKRFYDSMLSFREIFSSRNPKKYLKGKIISPTFKVR